MKWFGQNLKFWHDQRMPNRRVIHTCFGHFASMYERYRIRKTYYVLTYLFKNWVTYVVAISPWITKFDCKAHGFRWELVLTMKFDSMQMVSTCCTRPGPRHGLEPSVTFDRKTLRQTHCQTSCWLRLSYCQKYPGFLVVMESTKLPRTPRGFLYSCIFDQDQWDNPNLQQSLLFWN